MSLDPSLKTKDKLAGVRSVMKRAERIANRTTFTGAAGRFDVDTWFGLFGPAHLSTETTQRLNRAFVDAMGTGVVKARAAALLAELAPDTPEQFAAFVRAEHAKYGPVVRASGARVD